MRYLNKIVLINSAGLSYADIAIDGNVHFIGTQGVGKSTTLRAILFFYNADKLKLGIEKGKRSFDEYYFPFSNSYIIYEVAKETGPFCVLTFKSQGRVAFRFIEGLYNKDNYVSAEGKAMPWEKVRETFSGTSLYTRKIERYEEYRDILYGNNKGLNAEFRKYALIESRQYQNLPRTIQNVFLNSKLEAEFIKQTIIMSLNEEEVKIDLDQYSHHLNDFETQLEDIGKWSAKNRSGEVVVRVIADSIARCYTEIGYLNKEKQALALLLAQGHAYCEKSAPAIKKQLEAEQEKLAVANRKVVDADEKFEEKRGKINKEITLLNGKLADAKEKAIEYDRINITDIIRCVSRKTELENKRKELSKEKSLLTTRFTEITAKYDALAQQASNQLDEFVNLKEKERNTLNESFYQTKDSIQRHYSELIDRIQAENASSLENIRENITLKTADIHALELKKREAELSRWFEQEIDDFKTKIREADKVLHAAEIEIAGLKQHTESLQKQWDLDLVKYDTEYNNTCQKHNDAIAKAKGMIEQVKSVLTNRKNSFYEWLNLNKPGWEQNIGKVVDQQNILFHTGLSPQNIDLDSGFYGVNIDLKEITTSVKSILDYEKEIESYQDQIKKAENALNLLTEDQVKEHDKLRRKYQPLIKADKESITIKEYGAKQSSVLKEQMIIDLESHIRKAGEEKNKAIFSISTEIGHAKDALQRANEDLNILSSQLKNQTDSKKKERDLRISNENDKLASALNNLSEEIKQQKASVKNHIAEIRKREERSLADEGADVARLSIIDKELALTDEELQFIEDNRKTVFEYEKDKRELFDKTDKFKADKKSFDNQLSIELQKHRLSKSKLLEVVSKLNQTINELTISQNEFDEDLSAFGNFKQTDVFSKLDHDVLAVTVPVKTSKRLIELISEINDKSFAGRDKLDELRSAVQKFLSHFSSSNIFGFRTNLIETAEFMAFSENLKEFLEEDKIALFEKRTNERFANLISQIGKETTDLVSKEAMIQKVIGDINKDFEERNFAGVIKSIHLRLSPSANKIVMLLTEIRKFNDEHALTLGKSNLFSGNDTERNNKKAVDYLKSFAGEISTSKLKEINLSDTFELQFKIVENENDSGWVEKLTNVGSEGTDILVKAMINIMLLNVFKESASKRFKEFRLHCMMDEIGKLHPNNVKGILKFANDRNILLINSSPTSYSALDYRHTYLLTKDSRNITTVKKLITNN